MKNKNIFLRPPPENLEFQELFRFLCIQGVGNNCDDSGEPVPWNDGMLALRFLDFGYEIDVRTIQNWRSGANKPNSKNLNRISRIVSNDDPGFKKLWRDALTLSCVAGVSKSSSYKPEKLLELRDPVISDIKREDRTLFSMGNSPMFSLVLFFLIAVLVLLAWPKREKLDVTDLKFCDKMRFDPVSKICLTNVAYFPEGTTIVFVSFNIPDAPEGQKFERKWYRKGQLFLSKDGYIDSAWEGYTWLMNPNGHDNGKYDLRIIVNGKVTTGSFVLGKINDKHEWP